MPFRKNDLPAVCLPVDADAPHVDLSRQPIFDETGSLAAAEQALEDELGPLQAGLAGLL